ncbi:unnamed protein product [Closterium sp. NIES-54]
MAIPFCRVVPEPWRAVDNGVNSVDDLTVTALDGKLDSLKDGPDSSRDALGSGRREGTVAGEATYGVTTADVTTGECATTTDGELGSGRKNVDEGEAGEDSVLRCVPSGSSDGIECNSSGSDGISSDSNRGSDSSDIREHPGNCSTSSRADASGNGAADGASETIGANNDVGSDVLNEPNANECTPGESSTNSESPGHESAPSESAASEAAVRLVSAAALVAAGVQDAEEDSCSICLDAFSESDPATVSEHALS